jgi:hypothetical protein
VSVMLCFSEHVIHHSSPSMLNEVSLKTLTSAGAAAYLIRQSALVKQQLQRARTNNHIEDKLDALTRALEGLSSKQTALGALVWGVAKKR